MKLSDFNKSRFAQARDVNYVDSADQVHSVCYLGNVLLELGYQPTISDFSFQKDGVVDSASEILYDLFDVDQSILLRIINWNDDLKLSFQEISDKLVSMGY